MRTENNTPCLAIPELHAILKLLSVCPCVRALVWHIFSPIEKPFGDRFRCGKVHSVSCNKLVILHPLLPRFVPASPSSPPICAVFTIPNLNLFTDNYANWGRIGKRESAQAEMQLVWTCGAVLFSTTGPVRLSALDLSSLCDALLAPFWTQQSVAAALSRFSAFLSQVRNFHTACTEATRHLLLYSSRLPLSTYHRGARSEVFGLREGVVTKDTRSARSGGAIVSGLFCILGSSAGRVCDCCGGWHGFPLPPSSHFYICWVRSASGAICGGLALLCVAYCCCGECAAPALAGSPRAAKKRGDRNKNGHGGKLQSSDVLWRGHYPAYCRYFVHHGLCCCDDAQNLPPPTGLVLVRTNKTSQRLGSNWDETAACLRANMSFGVGVFGVRVRVRTRFSARRRRDPPFTSRLRKVIPGGLLVRHTWKTQFVGLINF